jgi:type I restriction enzyme, S subunit
VSQNLPHGWAKTDIGTLGRYINGRGFGKNEWKKLGLPIIRIQNLNDQNAPFNYSDKTHEERYRVNDGDLLVAWAASLGVFVWNRGPAWLNQHIFRVEVEERLVTKPYLFYALQNALEGLYKKTHGSGMVHVTKDKFDSHPINLPPLKEQSRIVSKIDELFSEIEEGERALEKVQTLVERYRQSVLKAAVTGELTREWRERHKGQLESGDSLLARILKARREAWEKSELDKIEAKGQKPPNDNWKSKYTEPASPDTTNLPDLPEGWSWARAEQLCDFITKGTTPPASAMSAGTGDIPYVKVYNLTFDGTLDFTRDPTFVSVRTHRNELARSRVFPGDVLMNIVGPPLGKVSIVPEQHPEWNMNQAVAVFRPFDGCNNQFLAFFLLSRAAKDWYLDRAKATAGQFNLTLEICRDTPIPLPSHDEQVEIAQLITIEQSRLVSLSQSLGGNIQYSHALKQSVLKAAFSGTLVSQDPADEPASFLLERITTECNEPKKQAAAPKRGRKKRAAA